MVLPVASLDEDLHATEVPDGMQCKTTRLLQNQKLFHDKGFQGWGNGEGKGTGTKEPTDGANGRNHGINGNKKIIMF